MNNYSIYCKLFIGFFHKFEISIKCCTLVYNINQRGKKGSKREKFRKIIKSLPVSIKLRNKLTDLFDIDCCNQRFESATVAEMQKEFIQFF